MTFDFFLPRLSNCCCSHSERSTFILIKTCLQVTDSAFLWCGAALSVEHLAQHQRSAWRLLMRPFRSLLIRASQLEFSLMFYSNQTSSVRFRRLHSGWRVGPRFRFTQNNASDWRDNIGAARVRLREALRDLDLALPLLWEPVEYFTYH